MCTLNNINSIYLGKAKNRDYLCIEDSNDTIILNLTTGKEETNMNGLYHSYFD